MLYHGMSGLADLGPTVANAVADLRPVSRRFDTIAVTGLSGIVIGLPAAMELDKPLVIARKPSDEHHGCSLVENLAGLGLRFLFLDDFIQDGTTARRVVSLLERYGSKHAATYLYARRILRTHSYKLNIRNSMPEITS